ncbi:hypothetical protein JOB18_040692 [Solea senegalensis]|uniref:Uncharacterized protein n=1 Tax=Solea senegalensis TaxID=28829 RepID=A0AAV6SJ40_SOLSE|nr:hypothetical protein JOB18_040692 [Solea senegalensis]
MKRGEPRKTLSPLFGNALRSAEQHSIWTERTDSLAYSTRHTSIFVTERHLTVTSVARG